MINCYLWSDDFVSEIVIITNFVVVSSVDIKRVVCTKHYYGMFIVAILV